MELKSILESVLFAAQKPMTPRELREILSAAVEHGEEAKPFKKAKEEELTALLEELEKEHNQAGRTYRLVCVAGSWQFVSLPEYAPWLRALVGEKVRPPRLSQPALETLAVVAYRQPVTRAEIEQIRGVSVDGVMQTLVERNLVAVVGRAEVVGRPMTYATTPLFLEYFGLRDLDELPAADELRRVVVQKPETLLTVEPGLATAPPEQLQSQPSEPAASQGQAHVEPQAAVEAQAVVEPTPAAPPESVPESAGPGPAAEPEQKA
jgi:segregation and condensation protein B